jgi:hypothetical protein
MQWFSQIIASGMRTHVHRDVTFDKVATEPHVRINRTCKELAGVQGTTQDKVGCSPSTQIFALDKGVQNNQAQVFQSGARGIRPVVVHELRKKRVGTLPSIFNRSQLQSCVFAFLFHLLAHLGGSVVQNPPQKSPERLHFLPDLHRVMPHTTRSVANQVDARTRR